MPTQNSIEDRRLLNPAFTGALVLRAAQGFRQESEVGIPFIFSFLVLPFVLHPETRSRMPKSIVTKLFSWTERNRDLLQVFPQRLGEFIPATREGVFVASTSQLIRLDDAARIEPILDVKKFEVFIKKIGSEEVIDCLKSAHFLGRWLSSSGTVGTVFTSLGLRL